MLPQLRLYNGPKKTFKDHMIASKSDFSLSDYEKIMEWIELKPHSFFTNKTKEEIEEWIPENLLEDLENLKLEKYFEPTKTVHYPKNSFPNTIVKTTEARPSETELEDAYHWVDSCKFEGSEKQIEWAKSIAFNHLQEIAIALSKGQIPPIASKWWIDNRSNIRFSENP
jgi:hypothetical protein